LLCLGLTVAISASTLFGQARSPQGSPSGVAAKPSTVQTPHEPPCWQEAGISKATMEERKQIEENAHSQVQAVCADSSLTVEQKREKIREIHQQAKQESEGLITPEQRDAMKACQQSRAAAAPPHPSVPHTHPAAAPTGPCGEILTPAPATSKAAPGDQSAEPQ